jgi:hypothetical protein
MKLETGDGYVNMMSHFKPKGPNCIKTSIIHITGQNSKVTEVTYHQLSQYI